jgi:hypothetical protein
MPIFSEIEEGRADKKYNSPEIDDIQRIMKFRAQLEVAF